VGRTASTREGQILVGRHIFPGLLDDDAGHRMIPTHATKAGIRYSYYVSVPHLKGDSKTVSVESVSRIPATDIETVIVKSVNGYFVAQHQQPGSSTAHADNPGAMIAEHVIRIDVHEDRHQNHRDEPQAPAIFANRGSSLST
jgi:site-specific DNA recombinase